MISPKTAQTPGDGRLPAVAPLANPYVPFQLEYPVRYEARKALIRGTLYPGLDLPLMGIVNQNLLPVTPLSELQALAFAIQELALYLDTECMEKQQKHLGPLTHLTPTDGDTYSWVDDPWPWEYTANKGE